MQEPGHGSLALVYAVDPRHGAGTLAYPDAVLVAGGLESLANPLVNGVEFWIGESCHVLMHLLRLVLVWSNQ